MKTWANIPDYYINGKGNFWINLDINDDDVSKASEIRSDMDVDSFLMSLNESEDFDCSHFVKIKYDNKYAIRQFDYPFYFGSDFSRAKELIEKFGRIYCIYDNFKFPEDKVREVGNYGSFSKFVEKCAFSQQYITGIYNCETEITPKDIYLLKDGTKRIKNLDNKLFEEKELLKYSYSHSWFYSEIGNYMLSSILKKTGVRVTAWPKYNQLSKLKRITNKFDKNWHKTEKFQKILDNYLQYCEDLKDISKVKKSKKYDNIECEQKSVDKKVIRFIKSLKIKVRKKKTTGNVVKAQSHGNMQSFI